MKPVPLLAVTVSLLVLFCLPPAAHAAKEIKVTNQRKSFPIWTLYITPAGRPDWGDDQLGGKVLHAGTSRTWTIPWEGCYVDLLAKTFTGLMIEQRNQYVCGGAEWTIYDDNSNPKQAVPGQPNQVSPARPGGTMTWRITDRCPNRESIRYRFFTADASRVWPSGGEYWYTEQTGESYDQGLSCQTGQKVCYGAWQPNSNISWGAGPNGTLSCDSCCRTCDGKMHQVTLTCD